MAESVIDVSNQPNWSFAQGIPGQLYIIDGTVYRIKVNQPGNQFTGIYEQAATEQAEATFDQTGKWPTQVGDVPASIDVSQGGVNLEDPLSGSSPTDSSGINQPSNFSAYTGNNNMAPNNNPWGDWSPVFGEYSPQDQYRSMMATSMPNYYAPRYVQMANRQFAPTFGRYLLGGDGGDTTGLGTGSDFSQWYQGQGMTPGVTQNLDPSNISAGYNQALQFGATTPGSTGWGNLASNNPGMAYAMQDPDAVQAMALSRYYGGGAPQGYAARAVQSSLGNLYDRYTTRGAQTGITGPSGFLNYLGGLNQSRFGAYPNA